MPKTCSKDRSTSVVGSAGVVLTGGSTRWIRCWSRSLNGSAKCTKQPALSRSILSIAVRLRSAITFDLTGTEFTRNRPLTTPTGDIDAYRGYNSSKRRFFYGLKVHMVTTAEGAPVEVSLTPGSYSDTKHLRSFVLDFPEGSVLYGDKAYNEYFTEDILAEACDIELLPHRKKNSKRSVPAYVEYVQQIYRKKIETGFSGLSRLLPKSIHAVTDRDVEYAECRDKSSDGRSPHHTSRPGDNVLPLSYLARPSAGCYLFATATPEGLRPVPYNAAQIWMGPSVGDSAHGE